MSSLGVRLLLMVGPTVPVPAPPLLSEALDSVEVTHSDEGASGFQIVFQAGRGGLLGRGDYPLQATPLLQPMNRVVLMAVFGALPSVLADGVVTHRQLAPGSDPGRSILTVTGDDLSVLMDLEERVVAHPGLDDATIARKLLVRYAAQGVVPRVVSPLVSDPPSPAKRTPVQRGTDLAYLRRLAERHGHVFYVAPARVPGTSTAYWGPRPRAGVPQKALTLNMGAASNLDSIDFGGDSLAGELVQGPAYEPTTGRAQAVMVLASRLTPPLAARPSLSSVARNVRRALPRACGPLSGTALRARAQARTDASAASALAASGQLDALRYGGVLEARGIVGVRGVGTAHDGLYYVRRVTHVIRRGEYKQRFELQREGLGTLAPVVRP